MTSQSAFVLRGRNPDILTCIANLSNDEVFTPPELANQMLDTLAQAWAANNGGANIWADKTVTFLDPCTKSGVFLREITSRLSEGLKDAIPDLQKRVDHILTKQVFGIGITQITSLLARRSVYCSKYANGEHSIAESFTDEAGNIWFERTKHTWEGNKCKYCGAPKVILDRSEGVENYAYPFIHTDDIKTWIADKFGGDMQFDVVIGNPPYQLSDGGGSGTSAAPIYQHFVSQAKKIAPRYLVLVTPARWFAAGKGLDEFREEMLHDNRLRVIEDFPDSSEVFPGVQIKGGVCYFLWNRDHPGLVAVRTHDKGKIGPAVDRPLLEAGLDVFIRFNEALAIIRKVAKVEARGGRDYGLTPQSQFSNLVSVRQPFGLDSQFRGRSSERPGDLQILRPGGLDFIGRSKIEKGVDLIDKWKVFIPFLGSGSDSFPHTILGKPFVGKPRQVCTESYLVIGPFRTRIECENVISYISTRLFRFLVLQKKLSQNATKKVYELVPKQDLQRAWTDKDLYKKYKLTKEEIEYIESMIRPMDTDDE